MYIPLNNSCSVQDNIGWYDDYIYNSTYSEIMN